MIKRCMIWFLVMAISVPAFAQAGASTAPEKPGLQVLHSDENGILLELVTPQAQREQVQIGQNRYELLDLPGSTHVADPGKPQLPLVSTLVGVPPGAAVEARLLVDEAVTLPDPLRPLPAPGPAPVREDLTPGEVEYVEDPDVYGVSAAYPTAAFQLGEAAWLRDQQVVRLELYPFQYQPAEGKLVHHRRLRLELRFVGGSAGLAEESRNKQAADNPFESALEGELINYTAAQAWRGVPPISTSVSPRVLAAGQFAEAAASQYRIKISQDGIYRLTYSALEAAGLPVATVNPSTFKLTSQGQDIAIYVTNEDGDANDFSSNESILFYGQKFYGGRLAAEYAGENRHWLTYDRQYPDGTHADWKPEFNATMLEKYTDENVYWLSYGGVAGARMSVESAVPSSAATPTSYRATVRVEENHLWKTTLFAGEETWFWELVASGNNRSYPASLTNLASGAFTAVVRGEIVALTYNDLASPDHDTRFYLNKSSFPDPILTATWDGRSRYRFEALSVPQSQLVNGQNTLDFSVVKTDGMVSDQIYFDWFEIEYQRQFQAVSDELVFKAPQAGKWKYQIGGYSGNDLPSYEVLSLANPLKPKRLTGFNLASGTLSFETSVASGEKMIAGKVREVPVEDIHASPPPAFAPAEYVIITPPEFKTAAQRLADYRAGQGLSTSVISLTDLYDQFNYGIEHPIAIRNFLAYTFANWPEPPTYAVLVGDGHWDMKGYLPDVTDKVYMPPNLVWVDPWQGEVDSANLLADVAGDDPLADVLVGRLPVNSPAELNAVIDKIQAYESAGWQAWQRRALFIADQVPDPKSAGDFVALSDDIIQEYFSTPDYSADRLYLNDYMVAPYNCQVNSRCEPMSQAILAAFSNPGALFVNYIGHASVDYWAHERILISTDIPNFHNQDRYPVVLSIDCLDGYWIFPGKAGMMEDLLRLEGAGAVATFSPTGLGVVTGHDSLHRGFYDSLLRRGNWALGAAAQSAKLRLYSTGDNFDLLHTFTLFGDPALRLRSQYAFSLAPSSAQKTGTPERTVEYLLEVGNSSGLAGLSLTDSYELSVIGNKWPVQYPQFVSSLASGGKAVISVAVSVPGWVKTGATDTVTVTVISRGDRTQQKTVTLKTTAGKHELLLPLAVRR